MRRSLLYLRQIHLYLGVFCAPAILFFAFTGALQSFGLNDRAPDGSYTPPLWVSVLAQIHKKQSSQLPQHRPPAPAPNAASAQVPAKKVEVASTGQQQHHNPLPERIFFLVVCVSLVLSTITGIWMSWKYKRNALVLVGVFVAGILIPLVLLKI